MNAFSWGNYWIQFHVSMTLSNTLTRFFPVVPKLFCKFKYPQICDVNNVSNRGCIQEIAIVILILFDIWALIRQCFPKWQKMILNDLFYLYIESIALSFHSILLYYVISLIYCCTILATSHNLETLETLQSIRASRLIVYRL